jgi:formamidopyrimidine-DNA glycosylase
MPELPEVETVRSGLAAVLPGLVIQSVNVRRRDLRIPIPVKFADRLCGRRVKRLSRRGKYLLWHFDGGLVLICHLGMSGRMLLDRAKGGPPQSHDHVQFAFDNGIGVTFRDPRRFGLMDLTTETKVAKHKLLAAMGPEPLEGEFDGKYLAAVLKGRRAPLKTALLDQRIVAGLGNIYVCEALYRARLSPQRKAGTVGQVHGDRLVAAIRKTLRQAIAAGGSSLKDYVQASGELGYFQHKFAVYGRTGERCPRCPPRSNCRVRQIVQSGRSTFYCPTHQR